MSAPPSNYKGGGNRYKFNYTLPGVDIKKISDNLRSPVAKKFVAKACIGIIMPSYIVVNAAYCGKK